MGAHMKKRILPVIIAILLILVIAGGALGKVLLDKYSYSKEEADWNEFYQVSESDRSAIILQDEMVEEQALIRDDVCYFDLATVHKYMNEVFYADMTEKLLLYANPTEVIRTTFGETSYTTTEGTQDAGYVISFVEGDTVYVAADYVKLFTNYSYDCYDRHVQVYTEWGTRQVAQLKKDTAVRLRGGVKSPILTQAAKGDTLEILEQMETWSKVKTADSVIGYVENKRLGDITEETETPVTDYQEPEYTALTSDSKICLGWHSIGGAGGNDTLYSMVSGTKGMNVIAPTWFSLTDENGSIRNFGTANYVTTAHNMGLQVWGVVDNFNYANETGTAISTLNMLSSTTSRQNFVRNVTDAAVSLGLDGINVDFEQLSSDCGPHYVEFIRELSIQCRNRGLVLSIANYVPFNFNDYYRLDIQGQVADYVIIMGYDEHWHGSKDPGSVASISYVSNNLHATINGVGTVNHLIAKDNRDQSVFYEAYSFAAGKLAIEDGSLKTEAKYYSTTAPAAAAEAAPAATEQPTQTTAPAQATQNSTSSEYDNVPKTGENSAMFWLLGAAVVCMAGGYTIRRKNVQEAE
jgi:hypothetical protein